MNNIRPINWGIIAWLFQYVIVIILCTVDFLIRYDNGRMQKGLAIHEFVINLVRLFSALIFILLLFKASENIESPLKRILLVIIQVIVMFITTTVFLLLYALFSGALPLG